MIMKVGKAACCVNRIYVHIICLHNLFLASGEGLLDVDVIVNDKFN